MFNDDYRWPKGSFLSDRDGTSTFNWDYESYHERQGFNPLYDFYGYVYGVDSYNRGWKSSDLPYDSYDPYSSYYYKDGGVFWEEPKEGSNLTIWGSTFEDVMPQLQDNMKAIKNWLDQNFELERMFRWMSV
ncbi:hypothetical protein PVK06_012676 [Gossypium arboreum]|uniref:Uncharacterized protein n=1 Tax=Gossypium arboreum TaxID=29729 RepID=A0ABR0QD64_GOSAR|nr:hypothetical protein PVK06_012676 [Gossypium arboreum]